MNVKSKIIKVKSVNEEWDIVLKNKCCGTFFNANDFRTQYVVDEETSPKDVMIVRCSKCKKKHKFVFDITSFFRPFAYNVSA